MSKFLSMQWFKSKIEHAVEKVIANKIENLTYLVVGKTLEEINDQYYGFPVTDKIVIRNK